ncbi:MAG: YihY family inner membrane protein [Betaproteobacteria bacterium]|nr:YihY family inner membrane protein [Betaproteobacteria bacterium]
MKPLPAFLRDPAGFIAFVFRRWREDRCPQIAGSLTFTTLLALVPLFTVVVALLSALPFFEGVMVQIKIFLLLNLVPEIAGRIITVYMAQFAEAAGSLTTLSLAVLFAMSIATLHTVDRSLNVIWRVGRHRPAWLSVAGYTALLVLGPALVGLSLWTTSWLVAASIGHLAMPLGMESALLEVAPVSVSALAFFLVYRIIPNRHVPARHALAGGILAAVVFEAMKSAFAAYIKAVPTYRLVYGAFASVPIFLLWLYLSWLVVLLGAEFTASLAYWRGRRWRRKDSPEAERRGAFEIGRALAAAGGEPVAFGRLRESIDLSDERLEDLLHHLVETGAVRRSRRGWALAEAGKGAPP